MDAAPQLVIVADDFGLGSATSRGILDLAEIGRVTGTVLLVNSPHAAEAVREWRRAGGTDLVELGWHACLTLDRPVLPAWRVPSLVDGRGEFLSLGAFLGHLARGRLVPGEVFAELSAQYRLFVELVGEPPSVVNGHHHVQVFPVVARALLEVLGAQQPRPYVRRVRENLAMLQVESRARGKRLFLTTFGRRCSPRLERYGHPGNDSLVGITDPHGLAGRDVDQGTRSLERWLAAAPGSVVELMCHPGHHDEEARRCDRPSALANLLARWLPGIAVSCGPEVRSRELGFLNGNTVSTLLTRLGLVLSSPRAARRNRQPLEQGSRAKGTAR